MKLSYLKQQNPVRILTLLFSMAACSSIPMQNLSTPPKASNTVEPKKKKGPVKIGIVPGSNKPLYTTPQKAPGFSYNWKEATQHCQSLNMRLPTIKEAKFLHERKDDTDLTGTFLSDDYSVLYWTSETRLTQAIALDFTTGGERQLYKDESESVRCVSEEPTNPQLEMTLPP